MYNAITFRVYILLEIHSHIGIGIALDRRATCKDVLVWDEKWGRVSHGMHSAITVAYCIILEIYLYYGHVIPRD